MEKIIVGIDPDIEKSGISVIKDNIVSKYSYDFNTLVFVFFKDLIKIQEERDLEIYIEASWLIKSLYNRYKYLKNEIAIKIAMSVGKNISVGEKIVEVAKYYGLNIKEVMPINTKKGKLTDLEIKELIKNNNLKSFFYKSNQEERDAILLSIFYGLKGYIVF